MTPFRFISRKGLLPLSIAMAASITSAQLHAEDLRFSGFLSVGGGMVDDETDIPYGDYDEEDLTFDNNIFGIQVSGDVNDKLSATAQLTARSLDNYEVDAEWAYLSWQATASTKIRAGRLRTPFYMFSDFLDVGYAYAWITPPGEVYYLPFNNVNGVDVYTTATLGSFDTSLQVYFGGFDDELDFNSDNIMEDARTRNQMGVAATLGKDWWTLRAAFHRSDLSLALSNVPLAPGVTFGSLAATLDAAGFSENADSLIVDDDEATFAEVGINIDTGRFVAAAEYVEFEAEDSMLSKNVRQYVMGGMRFGSWLVHVTASRSEDEVSHPEAGIPLAPQTEVLIGTLQGIAQAQAIERDVLTLGTRWDVRSGTAIKLQYDDVDDDNLGEQKVFSVALQTVF